MQEGFALSVTSTVSFGAQLEKKERKRECLILSEMDSSSVMMYGSKVKVVTGPHSEKATKP